MTVDKQDECSGPGFMSGWQERNSSIWWRGYSRPREVHVVIPFHHIGPVDDVLSVFWIDENVPGCRIEVLL